MLTTGSGRIRMIVTAYIAGTAIAALGGCQRMDMSAENDKTVAPASTTARKPSIAPKTDDNRPIIKVDQNIPEAMGEIPTDLRIPYQEAFVCDVKKRGAAGEKQLEVTQGYVHDLTARLKANPGIAKC